MTDQTSPNIPKFPTLTPTQRVYVVARARGKTISEASDAAGVSRRTPLNWNADLINASIFEVQQELFADSAKAVAHILPDSVQQLELAVKAGDLAAVKEVFDRTWGKATQRQEISGDPAKPVVVKVLNGVSMDEL